MSAETFTPYACSRGEVIDHQAEPPAYIVRTPSGQVEGFPPNGICSPENVESDLSNPPPPPVDELAAWNAFLAGVITINGIDLKASVAARDAFIGQVTLMQEGLALGVLTAESTVEIWDAHNVGHTMTVSQCRALIFNYGVAWQQAFAQLAP